ncbi:hypothetical protein A3197_00135 [Candidatus Thiodiazotropha endoloripes]|nr:hypothetical protein A3197_00135 [Candidatus Thiodiazotropha endoloripes]
MSILSQIVLANQAVGTDGRSGAGVDLVVSHLGHGAQVVSHGVENLGGLLKTGPLRHVEYYLEFRLVVERQEQE